MYDNERKIQNSKATTSWATLKKNTEANNLYGVHRKTMTISNAHCMFIFFPDCHFFLISSPLPQSFSPQPRNPSRSLLLSSTEIHSTCPLIGILLFLYLCIPLFIQNHMLMKSVIINLKYLIFRSVSASEGGWLEEQQRRGEGRRVGGLGGWKESCCSISLICIRCFKVSSNQSRSTAALCPPPHPPEPNPTSAPSDVQLRANRFENTHGSRARC